MLLNGCSYGHRYFEVGKLGGDLGFNDTINLSRPGTGNQRIFRTTFDYVRQHQVDFVIVMLSFWGRFEATWGNHIPTEGTWVSYNHNGPSLYQDRKLVSNANYIDQFIKLKMETGDWGPEYINETLRNTRMLTSWLKDMGKPYLIMHSVGLKNDSCFQQHTVDWTLVDELRCDPGVIDLVDWSSNLFMYQTGGTPDPAEEHYNLPPSFRHFDEKAHEPLTEFLKQYIIDKKLLG